MYAQIRERFTVSQTEGRHVYAYSGLILHLRVNRIEVEKPTKTEGRRESSVRKGIHNVTLC